MVDPRALTHAQLAKIVADVQAILWQESQRLPDDPHICLVASLVASYTGGRFPQVYEGLKGHGAEGVVLKRRRSLYAKHIRPGVESRDWLKRRFLWD